MTPQYAEGKTRMSERWYSVEEIAAHLGIGRETVYRWIDHKGLPAHRIGKFWKFKVSEVDEWARTGAAGDSDATRTEEEGDER
jgi:excisionase family DNA binding protein